MKHVLLALVLALGTMSCSKKEAVDPITANSNTGSYKLDGRLVNCTAKVTKNNPSGGTVEYLTVVLTTTPQPATGAEMLSISYSIPRGQSASAYTRNDVILFRNQMQPQVLGEVKGAISTNNAGGVSGTFTTSQPQQYLNISEGVFTDVRP